MSGQEEPKKKCPLCGETIPASAEVCPYCGAHLDIFELEEELADEDTSPLESFLESIGDAEDVDPEKLLEEMQSILGGTPLDMEQNGGEVEEGTEIPEGSDSNPEESAEVMEEEEVEYLCPVCEKPVGEEDLICPHCGAIFVEDEEDMKVLLDEQMEEAKSLVKDLRKVGVDVSDITPFLKKANVSKRKGDIETALESAIACVMAAKKKLDEI